MRYLNTLASTFLLLFQLSCSIQGQENQQTNTSKKEIIGSQNNKPSQELAAKSETDSSEMYKSCFVIICDTSTVYSVLHGKMFELNKVTNLPIDTLGRTYNFDNDLICLPENNPDEIYAGDYLPRQTIGESLSLEYLSLYNPEAKQKTIGLIAGIYESEKLARQKLTNLNKIMPKAYILESTIYLGCLH